MKLIGPITQLLTMNRLPLNGPIQDSSLEIIADAGILWNSTIVKVGAFNDLRSEANEIIEIERPSVVLPGFIDTHTHLCFSGNRAHDYALRVGGLTYLEIAEMGEGILSTVASTRAASEESLTVQMLKRLDRQLSMGITTCEVKSGYGLSVQEELKMLRAIKAATHPIDVIPTCLAAHIKPPEALSSKDYLSELTVNLFPQLQRLCKRIDIFVEKGAFSPEDALPYLLSAKKQRFEVVIHANQFTPGGAKLAADIGAVSADHLEHITNEECSLLKENNVSAIVLPGACIGLGLPYPPARRMLDNGLSLVIASDWNPGSAPMGHLLAQAAILGAAEKLTLAETLAALTSRAAHALRLSDRGIISKGRKADFAIFPAVDWKEILYYQGSLTPYEVYCGGIRYPQTPHYSI